MLARTWLWAALVSMLFAVVGCGPAGNGTGNDEGVRATDEPLKSACAPAQTVLGIDIASYQHPGGAGIDWGTVAANRRFVIIKASEGTGYTSSYYAGDSQGARAAGMIVGAYHYLRYTSSGAAQAQHFLASVGGNVPAGDLPPMLDVEDTGDAASPGQRAAIMKDWLDTVEAAIGRKPMIYSGSWYWGPYLGSPAGYDAYPKAWAAYVSGCPQIPDNFPGISFWQYAGGAGTTPGIQGACDQDKFYGSEAELLALADATPNYRAKFVGQSFPPAAQPFKMIPGQKLEAYIELENTGKKPWDSSTRLGTTMPRDRTSPFAASDWVGPNRPSQVSGSVNPGESYKFKFTFQAPKEPGSYDEHFGVVEEAVTWFSDPGQGGPVDALLEARIDVVQPEYAAKFVSQSFPLAHVEALELEQGDSQDGYIELENVGTKSWVPGETKLAPTPRDKPSPLGADGWLGKTRVSSVDHEVKPGEKYQFPLRLSGGELGSYDQTFALVEEKVTWFADAPLGGGPSDDLIRVKVNVVAHSIKPQKPAAPTPSPNFVRRLPSRSSDDDSANASCSVGSASGHGAPLLPLSLASLGLALAVRRRRLTAPSS